MAAVRRLPPLGASRRGRASRRRSFRRRTSRQPPELAPVDVMGTLVLALLNGDVSSLRKRWELNTLRARDAHSHGVSVARAARSHSSDQAHYTREVIPCGLAVVQRGIHCAPGRQSSPQLSEPEIRLRVRPDSRSRRRKSRTAPTTRSMLLPCGASSCGPERTGSGRSPPSPIFFEHRDGTLAYGRWQRSRLLYRVEHPTKNKRWPRMAVLSPDSTLLGVVAGGRCRRPPAPDEADLS